MLVLPQSHERPFWYTIYLGFLLSSYRSIELISYFFSTQLQRSAYVPSVDRTNLLWIIRHQGKGMVSG